MEKEMCFMLQSIRIYHCIFKESCQVHSFGVYRTLFFYSQRMYGFPQNQILLKKEAKPFLLAEPLSVI